MAQCDKTAKRKAKSQCAEKQLVEEGRKKIYGASATSEKVNAVSWSAVIG